MIGRWQASIAYALIGVELVLDEAGGPDARAVVAALVENGWTAKQIGAHVREVVAAEHSWPHPVPERLRHGCGPAQLHALITEARGLLDLTTMEVRPPSRRILLNPDERRLLDEVPPHHVR